MSDSYEDRENSLDGIHYQMNMNCENDVMESLIVETMSRLPVEVREYVYNECFILSMGESFTGSVFPPNQCWTVALNEYQILEEEDEDAMSIIAHEIVHAWLKHNRYSSNINGEAAEIEAASLTAEWGFDGLGSNVDYVTWQYRE